MTSNLETLLALKETNENNGPWVEFVNTGDPVMLSSIINGLPPHYRIPLLKAVTAAFLNGADGPDAPVLRQVIGENSFRSNVNLDRSISYYLTLDRFSMATYRRKQSGGGFQYHECIIWRLHGTCDQFDPYVKALAPATEWEELELGQGTKRTIYIPRPRLH